MELFLLPLLLVGGFLATMGSDDDKGTSDADQDDTLSASGTDRIFGGEGDDLLTLEDEATGLGGVGDDTITASDGAVGYGLDGDDWVLGGENATLKGGNGNDTVDVSDEALGEGGAGDDVFWLKADAHGHGDAGNDTLNAEQEAVARGGDGNDLLVHSGSGEAHGDAGNDTLIASGDAAFNGGAGADTFLIDHRDAHIGAASDSVIVSVQDLQEGDKIALLLGTRDTGNLTFYITPFTPDDNYTVVTMREAMADGAVRTTSFQLEGLRNFELTDLVLYGNEVGDVIDWEGVDGDDTLGGDGNDQVYGGMGNDQITLSDTAFGQGGEGNDLILAQDSTRAYGSEGNDALIAEDHDTTLNGGAGDDVFALDWSASPDGFTRTLVSDFSRFNDRLAVILGDRSPEDLVLRSRYVSSLDQTIVSVSIPEGPNEDNWPTASFYLEGEQDYDWNDLVLCGDDLNDVLDWEADPDLSATLTGGAGDDAITLNDSQEGLGLGGDDTLIANDLSQADGGAGNDRVVATDWAVALGGDGDDMVIAAGDVQYQLQPTVYGGAGNDIVSGIGDLHGDDGNDLIQPDADGSLFNGQDSYDGAVYGGAGDDTVLGDDSDRYKLEGLPIFGGAGNDLIIIEQGGQIDAGDGDDVVITDLLDHESGDRIYTLGGNLHPNYQLTTLGAGADLLALDVLLTQDEVDNWLSSTRSHVIADFDPEEDELALILPPGQEGAFTPSFRFNATLGSMELLLDNEASSMRLLLQGVTEAFPLSRIAIYADEAAVQARTPYATL